jgi:hypothetical protein
MVLVYRLVFYGLGVIIIEKVYPVHFPIEM